MGGVIRVAAKAAALGGCRSGSPFVDQPAATGRKVSSPSTSTASTVALGGGAPSVSLRPASRIVFGPVPTLEEAKEAIWDLTDAFDRSSFSSIASGGSRIDDGHGTGLSRIMCLEDSENKACITVESAVILPSASKHVVQAFSLLQGSPEVQNIVASLVSNEEVYGVIMRDEKVLEFCKSLQSTVPPPATDVDSEDSVAKNEYTQGTSIEEPFESSGERFKDFMHKFKQKAKEMASYLSNL